MNGAGPIHDWEFALIGATTESVARYIQTGEFGLWRGNRPDERCDPRRRGERPGSGRGARPRHPRRPFPTRISAFWRRLSGSTFPSRFTSASATTSCTNTPIATGRPRRDQLSRLPRLRPERDALEGGVLLNFGSAVMGPEVYLKALAMARNVAHQEGRVIRHFTTAVFDLIPLDGDTASRRPRAIRAITIGPGRRSWCAQWPTAARASISRATSRDGAAPASGRPRRGNGGERGAELRL